MVKMISHLVRNPMRRLQVSSSVLSADTKGTIDETGQPRKGSRNRRSISGSPAIMEVLVANAVDAEMGERIGLTIDSVCAACAWPVGAASAIGMEELNRTPQEYIAANAEKIRELGFKTPTLKFQNGDVLSLKFSVTDKIAQTFGGGMHGRSRQSDRAAPRWFFHRRCALEAQKTDL